MKIVCNKDLTIEERDILFNKVRQYKFINYSFRREVSDILELYGENNLDVLYSYVKEDMHIDNDENYDDEDRKDAIREYSSLSKKSLFRLQVLYSMLGCGLASSHLGEQFSDRGEYKTALKWFKKALIQGNRIEAGRGIMKLYTRKFRGF